MLHQYSLYRDTEDPSNHSNTSYVLCFRATRVVSPWKTRPLDLTKTKDFLEDTHRRRIIHTTFSNKDKLSTTR